MLLRSRVALVLILVVSVTMLIPLAYGSPPDSTWYGGLYDDDDFDNVVITLTGDTFADTTSIIVQFLSTIFEPVPLTDAGNPALAIVPTSQTRAPPIA